MKKRQTRKELSSIDRRLLYEGILDSLISLIQTGSRTWSQHTDVDTGKVPELDKDFDPKENLESQLTAAVCVLQNVGYAINSFRENLIYMEDRMTQISEQSSDDDFFANEVQHFFDYFDKFLIGQTVGWLQTDQLEKCSQRVYDAGQEIQSDDAVQVLEEVLSVFQQIRSLNIPDQARKVFSSEGADQILANTNLQEYFDETVPMFDELGDVIDRIEPFKENIASMLELAKEKAGSPEVAAQSEPAPGTVFESSFPKLSDILFD